MTGGWAVRLGPSYGQNKFSWMPLRSLNLRLRLRAATTHVEMLIAELWQVRNTIMNDLGRGTVRLDHFKRKYDSLDHSDSVRHSEESRAKVCMDSNAVTVGCGLRRLLECLLQWDIITQTVILSRRHTELRTGIVGRSPELYLTSMIGKPHFRDLWQSQ